MSLRGWLGTQCMVLSLQLLVPLGPPPLDAQQLASTEAAAPPAAAHASSYDGVFDSLLLVVPVADEVAEVSNLTIRRDAARFSLLSGQLYLLKPVGGQPWPRRSGGRRLYRPSRRIA